MVTSYEWGQLMSFRRFASLGPVLVLTAVLSACGASAGGSFGGGGGTEAATAGSSVLIVRAQLEEYTGRTAGEAVARLRRRWLLATRGGNLNGPAFARVVIDGTARGDLEELDRIPADAVESIRYLSAADATTRYGTGFPGGVIEVTSRVR